MTTPQNPYNISGIITDINSSTVEGASVQVTNLRTGESIGTNTNSNGEFIIDLANMNSNYADNDEIVISAYKKTNNITRFTQIRINIDISIGATDQNLTLVAQNPPQPESVGEKEATFREHDPVAQAKRTVLVGYTSTGEILPLKISKDSSGLYGLLSTKSG